MTKDTLYRAIARCIIFAEQSEEWSNYAEEVKQEALEEAKRNDESAITQNRRYEQQEHQKSA
jgi:hypothetical protein